MECPTCKSTLVTAHGRQIVWLTERYEAGEVREVETDDWSQRLGRWDWQCDDCGHAWTHVANTQAQWIGADAAQALGAYADGDHETMQACLEAIILHAQDLGYDPDRRPARTGCILEQEDLCQRGK